VLPEKLKRRLFHESERPQFSKRGVLTLIPDVLGPRIFVLGLWLAAISLSAQVAPNPNPNPNPDSGNSSAKQQPPASDDAQQHRLKAETELQQEEHQRIFGLMPNFNTSNVQNAEPLSAGEKLQLASKSALDPFTFVVAGLDAGLGQLQNSFPAYGQGATGYAKRFGASYADTFDGTMLGNALFPILLKQDPRYFRRGVGSFKGRLWYALASTVRCKDDKGDWVMNSSNVLGNLAAGGISNLYYPPSDRGAALTVERAFTVTAEGALGAVFVEFWPDVSRKLFLPRHGKDLP
jgi:hypothetical protein